MGKVYHRDSLSSYYSGNLFINIHQSTSKYCAYVETDTYKFNLNSKKLTLVKKIIELKVSIYSNYVKCTKSNISGKKTYYKYYYKTGKTVKVY